MISYSIIQKSQLEGALRLDAEYYQPEYLNLISNLKSQKSKTLGEIGKVAYGTTPSGGVFDKSGIPFVRSQNFSNLLIDRSELVFCTEEFHKQNKKSAIKPGDILFAAVGATGELAIVQDEIKEGNINQNIAAVRIADKNINPYFVGFFFASKPGQLQIERLITGNVQPYLNSEQIRSFLVPQVDAREQNEIASYFQEIQNQIQISNSLYSKAEDLLLEELGLKDFKVEDNLSYIVNLSEIKSAHRADAEYFQPKYNKLVERIKNRNAKTLGEVVSMKKGIEPGAEAYQDEGRLFIRVSSLSKYGIEDKDQKYLSEELYQKLKNNHEPKVGEILLTKDATPGIAYVAKGQIEGIISSGILRLKIKDKEIENEYLALCLNSILGQMQAEHDGRGSIITHWRPEQIKNILIPILSENTQKEIEGIIKNAYQEIQKSNRIYSQAENLLLEELGLKDFKVEDNLSYIVNLSEIKSAHRADAEYFQPKYEKLVERIKKHGADPLLSLAQNVAARFNPKSQPTKLFQYVELSNITSSVGTIDGFSEVSGDEAPSRAKRVLKTNDVILSSVEGSLEKVALAGKEQEGYLASNGFFQFRSKDILPEVLLVLAKSFILQMQFGKETAGTILTAVPKEAVKNIVVPKVDKSTQQKIADLVQKSHEARKKAKELLEEAKQKVENAIENEINK